MSSYYLQTAVGIVAGAIMCSAWWYAAIKFPRVWVLSGLAIIATISLLFYAGMLVLIASGQTSFVSQLSSVQVLLHVVEAVFLVLLVRWLVATFKDPSKP
jgi:uncharacterized protein YqhQ